MEYQLLSLAWPDSISPYLAGPALEFGDDRANSPAPSPKDILFRVPGGGFSEKGVMKKGSDLFFEFKIIA